MKPSLRRPWLGFAILLMMTMVSDAKEFLVYFGTYTNTTSKGIYVSRLDAATGKLSEPQLAATTPDPSFLAFTPDEKHLYAVNEFGGDHEGTVSAFAVDNTSGQLAVLNQKDSGGLAPCHVSVDARGKTVFVANYNSGTIKSFPLNADGSVGDGGSLILHHGHGVNASRQSGPHAHFAAVDPANRFVFTCDLGLDQVVIYPFDAAHSRLATNAASFAAVPPGSGARHLAFSHDEKFVYVVNEMACTVSVFSWNARRGGLAEVETVSALPAGITDQPGYSGAEILVHPSGKFVYATLRGHDSISVFSVAPKTGRLTLVQNISAGGNIPRGLGIDPTGHWLIAANQKSGNVVEFSIAAASGQLTPTKTEWPVGSAVDVKFISAAK